MEFPGTIIDRWRYTESETWDFLLKATMNDDFQSVPDIDSLMSSENIFWVWVGQFFAEKRFID